MIEDKDKNNNNTRSQHIMEFYEAAYDIPLPRTKVLAHIAGPSGSGKTELANQLSGVIRNIVFRDLDEFDDVTIDTLGWTNIDKNDYTDHMLRQLVNYRQELISQFIQKSFQPIVFVGHHVEAGYVTLFHAPVRIVLNVSPRTAAVRRYKRYDYTKERLQRDIEIGQEDVRYLRSHGYILMSPRQVYNIMVKWSRQLSR